jgi:prepilin-type processing-associated H-X9-DG protein
MFFTSKLVRSLSVIGCFCTGGSDNKTCILPAKLMANLGVVHQSGANMCYAGAHCELGRHNKVYYLTSYIVYSTLY